MNHIEKLLTNHPVLAPCGADINAAYDLLRETVIKGNRVYVCGNGGSAADCQHIVGEMMKGFLLKRKVSLKPAITEKLSPESKAYLIKHLQGAMPCHALTAESALISALCNDVSADIVFAQQIYGYGKKGDTLISISTSGNAQNVCLAAELAAAMGLNTIALTGQKGGKLAKLCACAIRVPSDSTPQIQEYHLPIYHALCAELERDFFDV